MSAWCKLYTDIVGDAKLLRAARKGAKGLVVLPWLFAWAKQHDPEDSGRLVLDGAPIEGEDVAPLLPGVRAADVDACMAACESIGVLVRDPDDVLRFATWEERSGKGSGKPSDAKERVHERVTRHRQKRRAAEGTDGNAPGNALQGVTGNDRQRAGNALEEEGEREGEGEAEGESLVVGGGERADETQTEGQGAPADRPPLRLDPPSAPVSLPVALCAAANQGLREVWGEDAPTPLLPGHADTVALAELVERQRIPRDTALGIVKAIAVAFAERARTSGGDPRPSTMRYFARGLERRWQEVQADAAAVAVGTIAAAPASAPGVRPRDAKPEPIGAAFARRAREVRAQAAGASDPSPAVTHGKAVAHG